MTLIQLYLLDMDHAAPLVFLLIVLRAGPIGVSVFHADDSSANNNRAKLVYTRPSHLVLIKMLR